MVRSKKLVHCNPATPAMSVSQSLRSSSATLLVYALCVLWHLPRCFAQTPTCSVKPFEITRNFRYSAKLSNITVPCTLAQVNISKLYLEGDCVNDDCSAKANASSCSSVFTPGNERNYWNLSLLPEQTLSSESFCDISVPIRSYLYINTTCTNFDINWVSVSWCKRASSNHTLKLVLLTPG
ncbi:hypothetical protein ABBQ38_000208 [Trebouxia sp. C0009 RCD-2024]